MSAQALVSYYQQREIETFGLNVPLYVEGNLYSAMGYNLKMMGVDTTKDLIDWYMEKCHDEHRFPNVVDLCSPKFTSSYLGPQVYQRARDVKSSKEPFTNKDLSLPRYRWLALSREEQECVRAWMYSLEVPSIQKIAERDFRTERHMKYGLTDTQLDSVCRMAVEAGNSLPKCLRPPRGEQHG